MQTLRSCAPPFRRAVLRGTLVGLCASATFACRAPSDSSHFPRDGAQTAAPYNTGSCDFDLTGEKADTVFFVLGTLDEYLGRRFVEESDRVESFYCNERPIADLFRRYVVKLATEQRIDPVIRDERTQECLVSFHSKPIADRLNSCYRYRMSDQALAEAPDGGYLRTAEASIGFKLFQRDGIGVVTDQGLSDKIFHRRRALAYLAGAWARFRHGPDYVFSNAREKATLICHLLTSLGCRGVRLESTFGLAPQGNAVHFQPTDEVKQWLEKSW
jgi:hypothetical protein